jgi:hypothetical protein
MLCSPQVGSQARMTASRNIRAIFSMPIAFLAFITVAAAVASVIWLPEDKPTSCERSGVRPGRTLDWNPANVLLPGHKLQTGKGFECSCISRPIRPANFSLRSTASTRERWINPELTQP